MLDHAAAVRLASALDHAASLHGPLTPDARARIFAAADDPTDETWKAARSVVVAPHAAGMTLWLAVTNITGEPVTSPPDGPTITAAVATAVNTGS